MDSTTSRTGILLTAAGIIVYAIVLVHSAHAGSLHAIRDSISTSAPSATSTHTLEFTAFDAVPAGGFIIVVPEEGAFTLPAGFDYSDSDLAVSTSTSPENFVDRALASTVSATEDGVSVVTGSSSRVTFSLATSAGIAAGSRVRIELGEHAAFGESADRSPSNPPDVRSYRVKVRTENAANAVIAEGVAMIAIVAPVSAGPAEVSSSAPVRSNGLPSGPLPTGSAIVQLSLNTDVPATCRYATSTGVLFSNMTGAFDQTLSTTHKKTLGGFANGGTYSHYIRCVDLEGDVNDDDFAISFSIKEPPKEGSGGTGDGGTGGGSGGGVGAGIGRGFDPDVLALSQVQIQGFGYPLRDIVVLQDGTEKLVTQTLVDGRFSVLLEKLERGTYAFALYTTDSHGVKSSSHTSVLTLSAGSNNIIGPIILAPTVSLAGDSVDIGESAAASGYSAPSSRVEIALLPQGEKFTPTVTTVAASSTTAGLWEHEVDTAGLARGTYVLRARTVLASGSMSDFGTPMFLGVGEEASVDYSLRADLNDDGKVNLIDFSMLLFHWNTSDALADINLDGTVSLADFSIMIFNWTG